MTFMTMNLDHIRLAWSEKTFPILSGFLGGREVVRILFIFLTRAEFRNIIVAEFSLPFSNTIPKLFEVLESIFEMSSTSLRSIKGSGFGFLGITWFGSVES